MANLITNMINDINPFYQEYEDIVNDLRYKEVSKLYQLYNNYRQANNQPILQMKTKLEEINYEALSNSGEVGDEARNKLYAFESELNWCLGSGVNSFQHAYGTALYMSEHDETTTRNLGIYKEWVTGANNASDNKLKDSYRDLHNNGEGISKYKEFQDLDQVAQNLFNNIFINSNTNEIEYTSHTMPIDLSDFHGETMMVPDANPYSTSISSLDDPRIPNNTSNLDEFNDYLLYGLLTNGVSCDLNLTGVEKEAKELAEIVKNLGVVSSYIDSVSHTAGNLLFTTQWDIIEEAAIEATKLFVPLIGLTKDFNTIVQLQTPTNIYNMETIAEPGKPDTTSFTTTDTDTQRVDNFTNTLILQTTRDVTYYNNNVISYFGGDIQTNPNSGVINLPNDIVKEVVNIGDLTDASSITDSLSTPIGAFYEGGTLTYNDSVSIADKTGRLLYNDEAISLQDFLDLDEDENGKINEEDTGFYSLEIWQDTNENGIAA